MSNSSTSDENIRQINLKGHKGPVISLAHSSEIRKIKQNRLNNSDEKTQQQRSCCLLSGSEDGTARLWDLKSSSRAALCIVAPSSSGSLTDGREVTAVSFHPILSSSGGSDEDNPSYPFTVYIAVGSNVYGYDLRNTSTPIVRRYDTHVNSLEGGEEINQIAFSNNNKVYLAVGDDDGRIRITDSLYDKNNRNNCRTLTHGLDEESSSTLVTTLAFRPRGLDLASGGTDCTVCLWDITRPRRPSSSFHIEVDTSDTAGKDGRGGVNQVCNPPIVHSLSWSPSGRLLAAGLGDGSSILFKVEGKRMVEVGRLKGGHDAAVASVLFPKFGGVSHLSSHVAAEDRLLVTAGNDGAILLWDLGTGIAGRGGPVDPAGMFVGCSGENGEGGEANTNDNKGNDNEDTPEDLAKLSLSSKDEYKVLFGIPHGKKPNWVTSSAATEQIMPSSLFVADTSNDITAYILPR